MNITNFAKKVAEKPVFKTRIKSDEVKIPEMIIGYFLAPFCAMFANSIFGAYLTVIMWMYLAGQNSEHLLHFFQSYP